MSYLLDGTTIRAPHNIEETTVDVYAQQKTLSGTVGRDYFGSVKRIWVLDYMDTKTTDYTTIKTIVDAYKSTVTAKTFQSTEANYTIASTSCHLDLTKRRFSIGGTSYISDFTLVLTEV
jgi:hypothetical protein